MREIEPFGLYIIRDQYFVDSPNDKYMLNKDERRPHFYAIEDKDGVYWMIPISSKVEKFREKIAAVEAKSGCGSCFLWAIAPVSGRDRAFIISEMFPVTAEYILRPYTVNGKPYIIGAKRIRDEITSKARRYLSMVERGKVKSPLGIVELKKKLLLRRPI